MICHISWRRRTSWVLLSLLVASAGCHHVIIESELPRSPRVRHEEWNMAFAYAIYPAKVDASEYCDGRWARVETRQSFLNLVVGVITAGILTPMDVKVVCAAAEGGPDEDANQPADDEDDDANP